VLWGAALAALLGCARAGGRPARVARAFRHPGLLNDGGELAALRRRVSGGKDPAFEVMRESRFASLDWKPAPRRSVFCGPYSRPDYGCSEEKNDATAAYTHALLWAVTGTPAHARKAIEILDAWSATLKEHGGHNAPLQSAWVASVMTRAAEIVRHSSAQWRPRGDRAVLAAPRDGLPPLRRRRHAHLQRQLGALDDRGDHGHRRLPRRRRALRSGG
jgi:hypothetical protein